MRYICVIFAMLMVLPLCISQTSPNTPTQLPAATLPASPNTPPAVQPTPPPTTIQTTTSYSDEAIRIARAELERDAYKQAMEICQKPVDNTKWMFTSILTAIGLVFTAITIILVLFGFAAYKETKKYEEAAAKAEKAAEGAHKCEQEAKNILDGISKQAKTMLDEIKNEGKKQIKELLIEAEKTRQVNELWNEALRLFAEKNYKDACAKCSQIIDLKSDEYRAYGVWCCALATWAVDKKDDKLFKEAHEIYDKLKSLAAENSEKPVIRHNQTSAGVLLAGCYVDAGKMGEAKALLDELEPLVKNMPSKESQQELTNYIAKMRQKPGMQ